MERRHGARQGSDNTRLATRFTRRVAVILISGAHFHFKFRRWKISTAPEMAIAEYSSAYTVL